MKKLLFALSIMFGAAVAVNAQDATQDTTSTSTQDQSSTQYRTDDQTTSPTTPTQPGQTDDATTSDDAAATQSQSGMTQDASSDQTQGEEGEYTEKEAISTTELPSIVRDQLQGNDYSGWTVGQAFRKEKDGQTFYAVELSNGSDKKMVKFDAQGNKVKEKDKKDKDDQ